MAELLDEDAITAALADLDGWERQTDTDGGPGALHRQLRFADFAEAMAFVNRVAEAAEAMNHHPDIAISWNTVDLTISSHSAGGVTADCVTLAHRIDQLLQASG